MPNPDEERENFLILLAEWRGRAKHAIAIGKTKIPPEDTLRVTALDFLDILTKMIDFVKQSS
jgi:hypothetical protein